ncbi:MAG: single-stranded-DNA-specific exonuclease RecJ, partial [Cyanobium sp.]
MLPALDQQRWRLPAPLLTKPATDLSDPLPEELLALLARRGFDSAASIETLLNPADAPPASHHFPDLGKAVERLKLACSQGEQVAICG